VLYGSLSFVSIAGNFTSSVSQIMLLMLWISLAHYFRHSRERAVIVGGFLLQGIGIVSILYAGNYAAFIMSMLIFGLGTAGLMPAYESLISKVVPESKRGLAFGFFGTTLGILSLPMPWLGAQMWERFTPQTPFWFSVIACAISIPIAWFKFVIKDNRLSGTPNG
jgi:MFS family permease